MRSGELHLCLPAFLDFCAGIVMAEKRQQVPHVLLSRNPTG